MHEEVKYQPLFSAEPIEMMPTIPTMDVEEVRRKNEVFVKLLFSDNYRCAAHNLVRGMSPDAVLAYVANYEATTHLEVLRLYPAHAKLEALDDEEIAAALRSRTLPRLAKAFVVRRHSSAIDRLLSESADEFHTEDLLEVVFLGGPVEPVFMHFLTSSNWAGLEAVLEYLLDIGDLDKRLDTHLSSFAEDWGAVLEGFPELYPPENVSARLQAFRALSVQKASS